MFEKNTIRLWREITQCLKMKILNFKEKTKSKLHAFYFHIFYLPQVQVGLKNTPRNSSSVQPQTYTKNPMENPSQTSTKYEKTREFHKGVHACVKKRL